MRDGTKCQRKFYLISTPRLLSCTRSSPTEIVRSVADDEKSKPPNEIGQSPSCSLFLTGLVADNLSLNNRPQGYFDFFTMMV